MSGLKTYTINSGKHYCFHAFNIHIKCRELVFNFKFTESCQYDLHDSDQEDINKLFGLGFGFMPFRKKNEQNNTKWEPPHHNNSYRLGWDFNISNGLIDLFHYFYNQKAWGGYGHFMCSVEIEKEYQSIVCLDRQSNIIWNKIRLLLNPDIIIYNNGINFNFNGVSDYGMILWPFFGGNEAAPHDIELGLKNKYSIWR